MLFFLLPLPPAWWFPNAFDARVAQVVCSIPLGQTLSYAQVALRAGKPGGARRVARALRHSRGLPWWRVIRSDGTAAPEVADEQLRRLAREGVKAEGRRVLLRRR